MLIRNMIFTVFCALLMAGCISGGGNPVVPLTGNNLPDMSYESLSVGVSDYDANSNPVAGYGALGIFSVHVDKDTLTGDMTPLRETASTDVLEVVDITNFMQMAPCSDCAKLMSIEIDADNNLVLKIGIKHPFPAGDPLKPPTGKNRADLHVFNVEGLIISDGLGTTTLPGMGVTVGNVGLINADGYSPYLDGVLDDIYPTVADVHPYVLHFDDYTAGNYDASNPMGFASVTDPPPSGNLVMAMGCDYDIQDYKFNMVGALDFIYAVGCTYAISADSKNLRFTPEYRMPQHLKKAASEVWVEVTNNELTGGDTLSSADLAVYVVDVNHGVAVGTTLDEMLQDSSVAEILVEVPGVTASLVSFGSTPAGGTGHDPSDPLLFQGEIANTASGDEGIYTGLVKVIDSYPTSANALPLLDGKDGIKRVGPTENPLTGLFDIAELATYTAFTIDIATNCGPITGSIISPSCPVPGVSNGSTLSFAVTASSDNGGDPIVLYEVDYDYDGMSFTSDDTSIDGVFASVGPFEVPDPCGLNIPHDFTVAFRATDSCGVPNETIFASCVVTVDNCIQWKNIPLRTDSAAKDLAVNPDGSLLILYDDAQVWKYYEADYFSHADADYLFEGHVDTSQFGIPPEGALCNHKLDVSDVGNIIACNQLGAGWGLQSFDPDGNWLGRAAGPGSGYYHRDVFALRDGSYYGNCHVSIDARSDPNALYGEFTRNAYSAWWWLQGRNDYQELYGPNSYGLGYDKVNHFYVVAAESVNSTDYWLLEGDPDYYAARIESGTGSSTFYYHYDDAYFGTGTQSENDTCWYNPKDLTIDMNDNFYVLDQLSDDSGRVKGFTGDASGGTSLGHFDVPGDINSTPIGIEGSDVEGASGNLIFILHGDFATDGCFLSVFLPVDIPW